MDQKDVGRNRVDRMETAMLKLRTVVTHELVRVDGDKEVRVGAHQTQCESLIDEGMLRLFRGPVSVVLRAKITDHLQQFQSYPVGLELSGALTHALLAKEK